MKRIAILGTPVSSGNRGVLALGSSLVGPCLQAAPDAEISLLLGHHRAAQIRLRVPGGGVVSVVPCRLSLRSAWRDYLIWIVAAAVRGNLDGIVIDLLDAHTWIAALREIGSASASRRSLSLSAKQRALMFIWDKVAVQRSSALVARVEHDA